MQRNKRGGNEAVRHHLHQPAFDAKWVEHEKAEGDKAHVRDRRIGDELFHVGLHQRDQPDVGHGDQRQRDHKPRQFVAGVGQDRQDEAQEAVGADLERNRRQHHRAAGGRFDVGIGQPGMHRPHRHLDPEREQKSEKHQRLRGHAERGGVPGLDIETAAGLKIQVDHRHQHQQRSGERVEEELERGIHPVRPAPHADNQVQRDQHAFEEHVEQDAVKRSEHAVDKAGHDEKSRHVLRHLVLDHLPAGDHHQHGDEAVEQDQRH